MANKWQSWDLRQVRLLQYQHSELLQPYYPHTHGSKSLPVRELLKSRDLISQTHTGIFSLLGVMNWIVSPPAKFICWSHKPPTWVYLETGSKGPKGDNQGHKCRALINRLSGLRKGSEISVSMRMYQGKAMSRAREDGRLQARKRALLGTWLD